MNHRILNRSPAAGLLMIAVLFASSSVQAAEWYVTPAGAGTGSGTSLANAWSLAAYNASSSPGGGDTVHFSGTFTATVAPNTGGTGNGAGRLVLDFTAATLNTANPRIRINARSYLDLRGGTFGPGDTICVDFNANTSGARDVTVSGWTYIGAAAGLGQFIHARYTTGLVVANNTCDNLGSFIWSDSILTHDLTIRGNYMRTSLNTAQQTDLICFGDAYNVLIEGNKLVQRSEGNGSLPVGNARHNDAIQCYQKGGSSSGNPYGWIVRYNWIELDVQTGSGDTSWMMLEAMGNNGSVAALKVYGNVFFGSRNDQGSNNGLCAGAFLAGSEVFLHNNTFIRRAGPGNACRINGPGQLYARNNLGWSPVSGWDGAGWDMAAGAAFDNNFFYNWQTPTAAMAGTHGSRTTDPLFTNQAADDYSLGATSTLRGAGDSSIGAEYNQGIAPGSTWPNPTLATRTVWDVGAYVSPAAAQPTVGFTAASSSGSEAMTAVNLPVTLSTASGQSVTVHYAVTGGTATGGGVDFTLASGTLTFAAGVTTQNIALSVVNDALDEADETVVVTLSAPGNATLGANTVHTYTITDNDATPAVAFAAASSSGGEATTAVNLPVALSAASGRSVTVNYAVTGGTATGGGVDFTLASGTLTFAAGVTTRNIALSVVDDGSSEASETVVVTLSAPGNATLGANAGHTYTIIDNDVMPAPVITGISPTSGGTGTVITITGTDLGGATVAIGSTTLTITSNTATVITATVPAAGLSGAVVVTTAGGSASSSVAFNASGSSRHASGGSGGGGCGASALSGLMLALGLLGLRSSRERRRLAG